MLEKNARFLQAREKAPGKQFFCLLNNSSFPITAAVGCERVLPHYNIRHTCYYPVLFFDKPKAKFLQAQVFPKVK